MGDGGGRLATRKSRERRKWRQGAGSASVGLLPYSSSVGLRLLGQKPKNCSLVTWATTRAVAWAALVLGPPLSGDTIRDCLHQV
jgi:hypothetical protein